MRGGNKLRKHIIVLILIASLFLVNGGAAEAESGYIVNVKTGAVAFTDAEPVKINDTIYIPLRATFEKLGCVVSWDPDSKNVTISKDNTYILHPAGDNKLFINGEEKSFYQKGITLNERILVPLDFFSSLGMEVSQESSVISLICQKCTDKE
jgi:hypothetical protein